MKNKKKKVLIALDYAPAAQKVAEGGYAMAKDMDAQIILLHVVADPVYYSSMEYSPIMGFPGFLDMGTLQLTVDDLKKASLRFLDKTKQHLGDKSIETIATEGDFAETILLTAKTNHVDIIVLGSHSRGWLGSALIGSVAEKVLHHSTIPLFFIPTKKRQTKA